MAKGRLIEELDRAVEAIIRNPDDPLPDVDSRIAPLVHIASDLRNLPDAEFQTRLAGELLASGLAARQSTTIESSPGQAVSVGSAEGANQIGGRQGDGGSGAELIPQDVRAALEGLPEMTMRFIGKLDHCAIGVASYSEQSPLWERHTGGEELLHVLEGELDVTTLTDEGAVHTRVPAGSIFVCPQGLWHWPRPEPNASLLFVTPGKGSETSRARNPRLSARGRRTTTNKTPTAKRLGQTAASESQPSRPELIARDVRAALSGVPELVISANTTGEEAGAAFPRLGSLNQSGLYAGRFSGLSPWERHTTADELLHVLEGEVEITTLTDNGPVRNTLRPGTVFVCPRGLWHRQYSANGVLEFSATPQPTEVSFAADPRV